MFIDKERKTSLSESIFQLDQKNIYFVGVINDNGRLVEYSKKQTKLTEDLEKINWDMLYMQTRLYTSMQSDHDENFGRFDYCITKREKTVLLTILSMHGTVLVICSDEVDSKKLVQQILYTVNKDYFAHILN